MTLISPPHIPSTQKHRQWPCLAVIAIALIIFGLLPAPNARAAERDTYQSNGVTFSIAVRTPEQIRAFYAGREFPEAAINEIASRCMLTVGIRNNSGDIVWLEPARWRFVTTQGVEATRISREAWAQRWEQLAIPAASRATFGWTQLPESRDLYPGETAGGNIAVVPPDGAFTVTAVFATGEDKRGTPVKFVSAPLTCDQPSEVQP
jgi:hypothetical protein